MIGKGGEKIKLLQEQTQAKIQVAKSKHPQKDERYIYINGTKDQYRHCKELINEIVENWRNHNANKNFHNQRNPAEQFKSVSIPVNFVKILTEPEIFPNGSVGVSQLQTIEEKN